MNNIIKDSNYKSWLIELKSAIQTSQVKAALAVNSQLIMLYWHLGEQIVQKQETAKWGSGFIDQLSKDLKNAFPHIGGLSADNLRYCKAFYLFYSEESISEQPVRKLNPKTKNQISEQPVRKKTGNKNKDPQNLIFDIPWGHHILILKKIKKMEVAVFYIKEIIANNWSRAVLDYQITSNLYQRQGKAITNFKKTLPEPNSDLANALLKDPYNFEFIQLSKQSKELELEQKLVDNITRFLLELGKGFAYMGRQFLIKVGGRDFKTDLLFYHTKLKCYVILELKITEFEPEYIGKLNFYVTAVDKTVKDETDHPTIGILLCRSKNNIVVDFALHDVNKPMGVSEFTYTQLPGNIKKSLPTIKQFTEQLNQ
jgi:predicted nuclease of restriction endonuclease-like (RecB) superfamily